MAQHSRHPVRGLRLNTEGRIHQQDPPIVGRWDKLLDGHSNSQPAEQN